MIYAASRHWPVVGFEPACFRANPAYTRLRPLALLSAYLSTSAISRGHLEFISCSEWMCACELWAWDQSGVGDAGGQLAI